MQTVITYSLTQLLQQFTTIRIPMIQRDYAQGRDDAKDVRNSIISSFVSTYKQRKGANESNSLNLDFVFGDTLVEGDDKHFQPLDGQQRITTLFLLHWYAALCNKQIDMFKQQFVNRDGKSKLSYQVRQSSNDFFNQLVHAFPSTDLLQSDSFIPEQTALRDYITNQSWFFLSWNNDPTIQSALTMLDTIHNNFMSDALLNQYDCAENLYQFLTTLEHPLITFQFLPLTGFGLSEDLYIKMNARGKPLTTFENTKAKIEQFLISTDSDLRSEFRKNIDSSWSSLLWQFRNKQTNVFDQQFMNLFRHVMIVTHNVDLPNNEYEKDIQSLRDFKQEFTFQRYEQLELISKENMQLLFAVLNYWSHLSYQNSMNKLKTVYFDEEELITSIFTELPTPLTYEKLVIFYAYIAYIEKTNGKTHTNEFNDWIRIISNLARNTIYNRAEDFSRSIRFIKSIIMYAENSLSFFSELTSSQMNKGNFGSVTWLYHNVEIKGSFYEQQLREEVLKAQLILASSNWQNYINLAESHLYFKGQIEFLFVFADLFDMWKSTMSITWKTDSDEDKQYQNKFNYYLRRTSKVFDATGINLSNKERLTFFGILRNLVPNREKNNLKNPDFIWERALLTKGDYLGTTGLNKSLLSDEDRSFDWKRLLRGSIDGSDTRRMFVKDIFDEIEEDQDVTKTLKKLVKDNHRNTSIELWRQMLIAEPECIEYCEKRNIRYSNSEPIYLLKKNQMNGEHAELYSYYFHMHILTPKISQLSPFSHTWYESVSGTAQTPYIHLSDSKIDKTNRHGKIDLKVIVNPNHQGQFTLELTDRSSKKQLPFLIDKNWHIPSNQLITNPPIFIYTKDKVTYDTILSTIKELIRLLKDNS
jgi:hypothetical protein